MMQFVVRAVLAAVFLLWSAHAATCGVLINTNAPWRFLKGTLEASDPTTAWRAPAFNDASWQKSTAPFFYGEALDGTPLPDMSGKYSTLFLRRSFSIDNPGAVSELSLRLFIDDGCVVWINGQEVARVNVPDGELTFDRTTGLTINEASLPIARTLNTPMPSSYLKAGLNVIAVQGLNASLGGSSDFQFSAVLEIPGPDAIAPTVASQDPPPGVTASLNEITVRFSEPVIAVSAADLLINGVPAADVSGGSDAYSFRFPEPPLGVVSVTWASGHGITDLASPPNSFNGSGPGATWQYTLKDLEPPAQALILPAPETLVHELGSIEVQFTEGVKGVDAGDLLINGAPSASITIFSTSEYVFRFSQPATGRVQVAWKPGHGITDLASPANAFAGGSWTYLLDTNAALSDVVINEFLAVNSRGIRDEDGDASDWIEIYNGGKIAVSLAGWFLTDDSRNLSKWRFPNVTINPQSYLVVFADEKNRTSPSAPLHTNFKLEKNGEYLGLVRPDRVTISSDYRPAYPIQQADVSYGLDKFTRLIPGYFSAPTPGAANSDSGDGFAPEVDFSRAGGSFTAPFLLTLSSSAAAASIYYTLDGSLPSTNSARYTDPIGINAKQRIRARAVQPGKLAGPVRSEFYFVVAATLRSSSSDLPILVIDTFGGGIPNEGDAPAFMAIFEPGASKRTYLTNQATLTTRVVMDRRGSSTLGNLKGNYNLEARDEAEQDKDIDFLGLPKDSDFILHAPLDFDPSLFHNPLASEISLQLGRYAPRYRFVEVYLNQGSGSLSSAEYVGVYNVLEKIKRGDDRVNIARLDSTNSAPPSVTGGYIFKVDRRDSGDSGFFAGGQSMAYVEPKEIELRTPQRTPQINYLSAHLNEFGTVLGGASFADPASGYAKYIDTGSWIDHHIINLFTFNVDGLRLSAYFQKDRNGKLVAGPVWDFDRALGSTDGRDSDPRVFRSQAGDRGTDFFGNQTQAWWGRLFEDIDFWQKWVDRWQESRGKTLSLSNLTLVVNGMNSAVRESSVRDFARWGRGKRGGSQDGETAYLRSWLTNRINFIDTNFLAKPVFNRLQGQYTNGAQLAITGPPGATIYYTTNGSDPRLPGGNPSSDAKTYSGQMPIAGVVTFTARSFKASHRNLTGPDNPPLSTPWSGLSTTRFTPHAEARPGDLAVDEIHYHPTAPSAMELSSLPGATADSFEFLELLNISTNIVDLFGARFTRGIEFEFAPNAPSVIGPGGRLVLAASRGAFTLRYGVVPSLAGEYAGRLRSSGGRLRMENASNIELFDFTYNDSWQPVTDGFGYSLVLRSGSIPERQWDEKSSWKPSATRNGSPGAADPSLPAFPQVFLNEVLTHTDLPQVDAVELHNAGASPAQVGNWFLTDDRSIPWKYKIPAGTEIPAGGFLVIDEAGFNTLSAGTNAFRFSALGDQAWLFAADAAGGILPYSHGFDFGVAANGVSFGRHINSAGQELFPPQSRLTLGSTNSGPLIGPVVINEIHYHPLDILLGTNRLDDGANEYIELHNFSNASVSLFDPGFPTNRWILKDAVDFTFPTNISIPAGGFILVVGFDPSTNAADAVAFRLKFQVPAGTPIYGPFSGKLDNSSDSVELARPDEPVPAPAINAGFVPYILADRVHYSASSPWPTNADGFGPSLQKKAPRQFGNDPGNWYTRTNTAGRGNDFGPIDTDGDGIPDDYEDESGFDKLNPMDAGQDADADGMKNLDEFLAGTNPRNPASVLRAEAIKLSPDGGQIEIQFQAAPGKAYSIWKRASLVQGTWEKVKSVGAIQAGGTAIVTLQAAAQDRESYYQIRLE